MDDAQKDQIMAACLSVLEEAVSELFEIGEKAESVGIDPTDVISNAMSKQREITEDLLKKFPEDHPSDEVRMEGASEYTVRVKAIVNLATAELVDQILLVTKEK